ncbi:hypothetical protein GN244_ATG12737 [Phytophthora infestans]|uniref:Uncharacterized protein n=1 Tax=Phytophthora infestans TaxID=4787 RepID=A0A833SYG5_PHYIN|nr:hypothetical protein GN244_ATG12737 [Phytophthora infestans]
MPPLTATPKPLEPVMLAQNASDAWLKKVFGPRERPMESLDLDASRRKSVSANDREDYEEHRYTKELMKYIAESTASLSASDAEPLSESNSDNSDEPWPDIFDCASDEEDDYVEPPVEVPRTYRAQDLHGGEAFRPSQSAETLANMSYMYLRAKEPNTKGVYSGKIVEL